MVLQQNIAQRISGWYVCYEVEFEACYDHWMEFHDDASAGTFHDKVVDIILELADTDVPPADRTDVAVAAFWAATADAFFIETDGGVEQAQSASNDIREALNSHDEW